ncbi:MAG: type II toxin-antitoxin system HicA family toxin [Proteobacteria bacterium]|nr:type II toxin-antitoxin system HicA family toxin [Pseudomonadota bacterium]
MQSRIIIKLLQADGWHEVAHQGDHKQFKHPVKKGRVTLTHPVKDVNIWVIRDIERKSGVKLRHRKRRK